MRLGFRRELEAIEDPDERERAYDEMVDAAYPHGRAINVATTSRSTTSSTRRRPGPASCTRSTRRAPGWSGRHGGAIGGRSWTRGDGGAVRRPRRRSSASSRPCPSTRSAPSPPAPTCGTSLRSSVSASGRSRCPTARRACGATASSGGARCRCPAAWRWARPGTRRWCARARCWLPRAARSKGVHVLLGPTVCIPRTPLAGRTFESFSEDPLLTARLAVSYVRGRAGRRASGAASSTTPATTRSTSG